ncbi:MAG TPA: hypothetical protein VFX11_01255 [Candidatus Kapabacteria bacterium]|nr:hypothetical protein [Candidatus Kapabacteria bacterium]
MHYFRIFCLLLWSWAGTALASSLPPLSENEAYKPILVEGEDLPMALGVPLEELSLAAIVDDVMEPVPFQIDQYSEGGAPWFDGWEIPLAGASGRLNPTDKLLFIYKDAGPRRVSDVPVDGTVLADITLTDSDGVERHVYLLRHSRLRSEEQYVRYSAELGQVETDFYSLRYQGNNHLRWDDLQFAGFVGERPLDSMKLKVSGGVMLPQLRMDLTNDNMVATPAGAIIGPIRTTTQADFNVHFMGVHVVRFSLQIHHYPKSVIYDVRGVMPGMLRQFAAEPTVSMEVDANSMLGAQVRTATGPQQPATVDGKMGELESAMLQAGMNREQNWVWVSSKRNLDILAFLDYAGDFNEPFSLLLQDDLHMQEDGEMFPGRLPSVGYRIDHLPEGGSIGILASIYFSADFGGEPGQVAQQLRTQPEMRVIPVQNAIPGELANR